MKNYQEYIFLSEEFFELIRITYNLFKKKLLIFSQIIVRKY